MNFAKRKYQFLVFLTSSPQFAQGFAVFIFVPSGRSVRAVVAGVAGQWCRLRPAPAAPPCGGWISKVVGGCSRLSGERRLMENVAGLRLVFTGLSPVGGGWGMREPRRVFLYRDFRSSPVLSAINIENQCFAQ